VAEILNTIRIRRMTTLIGQLLNTSLRLVLSKLHDILRLTGLEILLMINSIKKSNLLLKRFEKQ
jgi:hypothetical protein